MEQLTPQQIAQHYSAALDSVTLINAIAAQETKSAEDIATLQRNVQHLQIMLSKPYWTTEDLGPFNAAVQTGLAEIPATAE
jgi:hypothetical protein